MRPTYRSVENTLIRGRPAGRFTPRNGRMMSDSPAMRCKEFIESYTEYCDGRLAPEERERFDGPSK